MTVRDSKSSRADEKILQLLCVPFEEEGEGEGEEEAETQRKEGKQCFK